MNSFNTQPPEGGWFRRSKFQRLSSSFNTQPPEGGWLWPYLQGAYQRKVSTHSRPRAAGSRIVDIMTSENMFQHTAARGRLALSGLETIKEVRFQHTAARGRLEIRVFYSWRAKQFQHTAA